MRNKINLYSQYLNFNEEKRELPWLRIMLCTVSVSIMIIIIVFTAHKIKNITLIKQEQSLLSFIESKENINKFQSAKENQVDLEDRLELHNKIYGVNLILKEKRQFNPSLFDQIELSEPYGVRSRSLKFSNGKALIDYDSKEVEGPSVFAQNLKHKVLIKDVKYQGFKKENNSIVVDTIDIDFDRLNQNTRSIDKLDDFFYRGQIEIILEGGY